MKNLALTAAAAALLSVSGFSSAEASPRSPLNGEIEIAKRSSDREFENLIEGKGSGFAVLVESATKRDKKDNFAKRNLKRAVSPIVLPPSYSLLMAKTLGKSGWDSGIKPVGSSFFGLLLGAFGLFIGAVLGTALGIVGLLAGGVPYEKIKDLSPTGLPKTIPVYLEGEPVRPDLPGE